VFIATQLNSTQLNSTDPVEQCTAKSVVFLFMTSRPTNWVNWVTTFIDRWQLFTLWTCRQLDVELSWVESSCVGVAIDTSPTQLNSTRRRVELCRYKRALNIRHVLKNDFFSRTECQRTRSPALESILELIKLSVDLSIRLISEGKTQKVLDVASMR